jgi:hypothetical protein
MGHSLGTFRDTYKVSRRRKFTSYVKVRETQLFVSKHLLGMFENAKINEM